MISAHTALMITCYTHARNSMEGGNVACQPCALHFYCKERKDNEFYGQSMIRVSMIFLKNTVEEVNAGAEKLNSYDQRAGHFNLIFYT